MRRNRIILLILWIISLVGISFAGGPVTYGFFTLFTIVPVFSWIYILIVRFRFRIYQQSEARTLVVGRKVGFKFNLQNEDLYAFAGIRVQFLTDFSSVIGLDGNEEYELFPMTGISKETELVCKYRGRYEVGVDRIIITDYFRLFSTTFKNKRMVEVYVQPRLVHLTEVRHANLTVAAAKDTAMGDSADILTREYMPGDDIRYIHWKNSARRQQLMVRKTIGEDQPGVGIIMDSCRYSDKPTEYLPVENKILETVLALVYYYLENGIPVQNLYLEKKLAMSRTENVSGYDGFYGKMNSFEFKSGRNNKTLFTMAGSLNDIYKNRMMVFVIHEWCAEIARLAEALSSSNIPVIIYMINDNAEAVPVDNNINRCKIIRVPVEADLKEVL